MHKIYRSRSKNPYFNLAFEEYLVRRHDPRDETIFLWQNQNTVVIGRNQNPWKECNLEELNRQGGRLVRRLSGGGAVYHDLGNLNFTFVSAYSDKKIKENIGLIVEVLARNGILAVFSGKNDILVQNYKVSGNAYFVEEDILCHHGTLLVDVDSEQLSRILTVSRRKLESKGIDSIKSRVKNLKEFNDELFIEKLIHDLTEIFVPPDGVSCGAIFVDEWTETNRIDREAVRQLMQRYESWEWNFGSSPEFNLKISERFQWGEIELYLLVKDGIIAGAEVSTDALDIDLPQRIRNQVCDRKFDYKELISLLQRIA